MAEPVAATRAATAAAAAAAAASCCQRKSKRNMLTAFDFPVIRRECHVEAGQAQWDKAGEHGEFLVGH